jgi:Predicted transcriptional regulators
MESGTVLREIDNVMMGKIMKERREEIGMSQQELAEKLGFSMNYIGYLENGARRPALDAFFKISQILEISPDHLLYGEQSLGVEDTVKYDNIRIVEKWMREGTREDSAFICSMVRNVMEWKSK